LHVHLGPAPAQSLCLRGRAPVFAGLALLDDQLGMLSAPPGRSPAIARTSAGVRQPAIPALRLKLAASLRRVQAVFGGAAWRDFDGEMFREPHS
jgi:hypothetical protein